MSGSAKKRVAFRLEAPEAQEVFLVADFNDWEPNARRLKRSKDGVWSTWTMLPPGRYEYRYLVDGEWTNASDCAELVPNEYGTENSVVTV